MSQSIVPINIRKHLIPFFYKEFHGTEVLWLNKKVKACQINMNSSIGFLLRITMEKIDKPVTAESFNMFLSVSDQVPEANIYKCVSGEYSFLWVPSKVNDKINDMLEDQMRVAFVYYVEGMLKGNPKMKVRTAILYFMQNYDMEESEFEIESLRRLLNREQEKNTKLSRMQNMSANRVKHRA